MNSASSPGISDVQRDWQVELWGSAGSRQGQPRSGAQTIRGAHFSSMRIWVRRDGRQSVGQHCSGRMSGPSGARLTSKPDEKMRSPKRMDPSDSGCFLGPPAGWQKWNLGL